ncbi:hypothetical protein LWX53_00790 [bacterium]|nr:hypothetical protein [bacterium]
MRLRALAFAAMVICLAELPGQPSGRERLGTAPLPPIAVSIESSLRVAFPESAGDSLWLWPAASCDIAVGGDFHAAVEVPFAARLDLAANAKKRAAAALGDLGLSAGGSLRAGKWLLSAELSYAHPTGIWYGGQAEAAGIRSGGGYRTFGASLGAIRISDPVMLGVSLGAEAALPRRERFGGAEGPLSAKVRLFATEALNGSVALSAGLSGGLELARGRDGQAATLAASFAGSVSLILSGTKGSFRIGASRLLSDPGAPTVLEFGCSRRIAGKE